MTCVVGVRTPQELVFAGDTGGVEDDGVWHLATQKVHRIGDVLVGYSGGFRVAQFVLYKIIPNLRMRLEKADPVDLPGVIAMQVATEIGSELSGDFAPDPDKSFHIMLGVQHRIFIIDAGLAAVELSHDVAIGAGASYAEGALFEAARNPALTAYQRAARGLTAAQHFQPGYVVGPYTFASLENPNAPEPSPEPSGSADGGAGEEVLSKARRRPSRSNRRAL